MCPLRLVKTYAWVVSLTTNGGVCLSHNFLKPRVHTFPSNLPPSRMAHPTTVTIPALNKRISIPTGLFINNEFVPSVDSSERIKYTSIVLGTTILRLMPLLAPLILQQKS